VEFDLVKVLAGSGGGFAGCALEELARNGLDFTGGTEAVSGVPKDPLGEVSFELLELVSDPGVGVAGADDEGASSLLPQDVQNRSPTTAIFPQLVQNILEELEDEVLEIEGADVVEFEIGLFVLHPLLHAGFPPTS